jgi:hypothetical protein
MSTVEEKAEVPRSELSGDSRLGELVLGHALTHCGRAADASGDGHEQVVDVFRTRPLQEKVVCSESARWKGETRAMRGEDGKDAPFGE